MLRLFTSAVVYKELQVSRGFQAFKGINKAGYYTTIYGEYDMVDRVSWHLELRYALYSFPDDAVDRRMLGTWKALNQKGQKEVRPQSQRFHKKTTNTCSFRF